MGKTFDRIELQHREFILRQPIFFNASAAAHGRVNVSPRDGASLRVLGPNSIVYRDLTGSGNETAAHLLAHGRLTLMFCSFDAQPLILRLYGSGRTVPRADAEYRRLLDTEYAGVEVAGSRQMVMMTVDLVQTSCGFGVPLFNYVRERDTLVRWAESKGEDELEAYRQQKNAVSLDGLPTGLFRMS